MRETTKRTAVVGLTVFGIPLLFLGLVVAIVWYQRGFVREEVHAGEGNVRIHKIGTSGEMGIYELRTPDGVRCLLVAYSDTVSLACDWAEVRR